MTSVVICHENAQSGTRHNKVHEDQRMLSLAPPSDNLQGIIQIRRSSYCATQIKTIILVNCIVLKNIEMLHLEDNN